jgi:ribosomal protein S18 acetylase RimI-like enzyme
MSIEIRRIKGDDEAAFHSIARDVFDEPVNPQRLKDYLFQPGHMMILAINDGEVVGQCAAVIHRHPDKVTELYIDEVGVGSDYRRQGIARRMMDDMFAWGRSLGCEESWVGTETDNVAAKALYDSYEGEPLQPFVMYVFKLRSS